MAKTMTSLKRAPWGLMALLAGLALAMWSGGQVSVDRASLESSPLMAILGGDPAIPLLTHSLIGLLMLAATLTAVRLKIVPVPPLNVTIGAVLLITGALAATLTSAFKATSVVGLALLLLVVMTFFTTAAIVGRGRGPRAVVLTVVALTGLLALRGLIEYASMKAIDPSWRVFGGWISPNAFAAVLLPGIVLGLTLTQTEERLGKLGGFLAATVGTLALLLTGSKGGVAVLAVAVIGYALVELMRRRKVVPLAAVGLTLLAGVMSVGLKAGATAPSGAPSASGPGALGRMQSAEGTAAQSGGFRVNLWRSSLDLAVSNPMGTGPGTFKFYSAQPGRVTQTNLAHQSYLQLLVETGWVGFLGFLIMAGAIVVAGWQGGRTALRTGVGFAALAGLGHGFIDSDLQVFGTGILTAVLAALYLLVGPDGVIPEFVPRTVRLVTVALGLMAVGITAKFGVNELARSAARADMFAGRLPEPAFVVDASDPASQAFGSRLAPTPEAGIALREAAAQTEPSVVNLRGLGDLRRDSGDPAAAMAAYRQALRLDPHNLPTLKRILDLAVRQGNEDAIRDAARKLIAVESTPYFTIRSLPELVPTETYEARLILAGLSPAKERRDVLLPALQGFQKYLKTTVPLVRRMGDQGGYGGETLDAMRRKLELGARVAEALGDARSAATFRSEAAK